jgi:Protein of unknown function (DUF2716)
MVATMSGGFSTDPGVAWQQLDDADYDRYWAKFESSFGFRAGVGPESWPAIREPAPSITLDLSVIRDGAERGAAYDAINAEALRAFVWALPEVSELIVLDWQHSAYRFKPAVQALIWRAEWIVPVYPNGDYYAFLGEDFSEGTFGHPWEQTLCVVGERLIESLGQSLSTWLPIARRDGQPIPQR